LSQKQILKSDFGGGHDGGRRGKPMVEIGEVFRDHEENIAALEWVSEISVAAEYR